MRDLFWILVAIGLFGPLCWAAIRLRIHERLFPPRCPACGYRLSRSDIHCPNCETDLPEMLFRSPVDRVTLEGVFAFLFIAAIVGNATWQEFVAPAIYGPSYGTIKHGPKAFPSTVTISNTGITVTNDSQAEWITCHAEIGQSVGDPHRVDFHRLQPYATVVLTYTEFQPAMINGHALAPKGIGLDCRDEYGVNHHVSY
jgi:hypothetical protein